LTKKNQ